MVGRARFGEMLPRNRMEHERGTCSSIGWVTISKSYYRRIVISTSFSRSQSRSYSEWWIRAIPWDTVILFLCFLRNRLCLIASRDVIVLAEIEQFINFINYRSSMIYETIILISIINFNRRSRMNKYSYYYVKKQSIEQQSQRNYRKLKFHTYFSIQFLDLPVN